jgi:hypothetical protein
MMSVSVAYVPFLIREEVRSIDHDEHVVEVERVAGRLHDLQ